MTKKPNYIYVFDEKEYSEEEQILLITNLAKILLDIDKELEAA